MKTEPAARGDHKIVGLIMPTTRPDTINELIPILPRGVGIIPVYLQFRQGTADEFREGFGEYERQIGILADHDCDIIHPLGAPPFMVQGLEKETALVGAWQQTYRTPIFTSGQNHVRALRALNVKAILGVTYFLGDINDIYSKYFEDAGFVVTGMQGLPGVDFAKVQEVPSSQIYDFIKASFEKAPAEAIYILGSGWHTLDIVERLEQDLGVPVIHPQTARVWEIQKRLGIAEPREGYGSLMTKLPSIQEFSIR
ncbi:maleate isomerase [Sphingomonas vulcanisoli]|uniref:Maleate isomerase n=2 Tax=Sphingomonas vulcanisoli TaxID=1658060 RepID=A0ABX0TUN0_9SPHN|nr:maleate isomerase [Sphingomonas vulcanisoli]